MQQQVCGCSLIHLIECSETTLLKNDGIVRTYPCGFTLQAITRVWSSLSISTGLSSVREQGPFGANKLTTRIFLFFRHFTQQYLLSCKTVTGKGCFLNFYLTRPMMRIYLDQGHVTKAFTINQRRYSTVVFTKKVENKNLMYFFGGCHNHI